MYRILIIDDEQETRQGLKLFIENSQYPLEVVGVMDNALGVPDFIRQHPVDIVITDIVMPELMGTELAAELHRTDSRVKIIMISGYDDVRFIKAGLKCDIVDYILKPIDLSELDEVIKKAIRLCEEDLEKKMDSAFTQEPGQEILGAKTDHLRPEIRSMIEMVHDKYSDRLILDAIAGKLYLTPAYLSSLFKKETGENFIDFLTRYRIDKAKELLADFRLKIYEVSSKVGYDDPTYFGKVFKKYCGVNPAEYRKKQYDKQIF